MAERDGWKHDDDGWYDEQIVDGNDSATDATASAASAANPYRVLPPRTPLEDTVGEVDASPPPEEPTSDPNRQDAIRLGLMGGAG